MSLRFRADVRARIPDKGDLQLGIVRSVNYVDRHDKPRSVPELQDCGQLVRMLVSQNESHWLTSKMAVKRHPAGSGLTIISCMI